MSASVKEASPQAHLTAVKVECPDGHITGTQAPGGSVIRCGLCNEAGKRTLVTVPLRAGETPQPSRPPRQKPDRAAKPDARPDAPATAACRTCDAVAPGALPPGWLVFLAGADPAATRNGKPFRRLGPWCSARCAAAGLHGATMTAGVRPGPRQDPERGELARLMTQPPRGRAS